MKTHATAPIALAGVLWAAAGVQAQADPSVLARQLEEGSRAERMAAADRTLDLPADRLTPALKRALVQALLAEREVAEQRRRGLFEPGDHPALLARLASAVVRLDDTPGMLPALAGALGVSPPAINFLALRGPPAAAAILAELEQTSSPAVYMGGFIALRYMIEGAGGQSLPPGMVDRIREKTRAVLATWSDPVVLNRAIDLAIELDDPELRTMVEAIAADEALLVERGLTNTGHIEYVQNWARERLNGGPSQPPCCPDGA